LLLSSGRWGGYGRQTVEASPCIEISALRRAGYIGKVPGNWWVQRERLSRKGIQPNHWTDSLVSLDGEALQVTWMPGHFGGCRAYFLCACGRTVEKLYAPRGRLWRCRHCHDLSYESRQTAPHYRQLVKAQKIRERLAAAQSTKFSAGERVDRGYAALEPRDVQSAMGKVDLLPAQRAQLGRSQSVPEGQEDHGRIPMAVPVSAGGALHQPLDISLGQVLAGSIMPIWAATTPNCSL
jgi:hypothetical protein